MAEKNVLVALSGGVDSSVAVHLLRQQGWQVEAVVLEFSPAHQAAVAAATAVARQLGVRLHVVRCHQDFWQNVVTPFCQEYRAGRTPNPCILCNPTTKFQLICRKAEELGFPYIATGHYAQVQRQPDQTVRLKKAACLQRDQSYMLYRLTQRQLGMLLLPLQGLEKSQVRQIALEQQLASAQTPDSQEICWLPDGDYPSFIEEHFGSCPPGPFLSPDGVPCGSHRGLLHYTVGQRKRLGVSLGYPVFIREIDPASNAIHLARAGEEYASQVLLDQVVLQPNPHLAAAGDTASVTVKVRSRAADSPAQVTLLQNGCAQVLFQQPERAPAPGQSCVFYLGDWVLGGGFIRHSVPAPR